MKSKKGKFTVTTDAKSTKTNQTIYKTLALPLTKKQYYLLKKKANQDSRSMTSCIKQYASEFIEIIVNDGLIK